MASFFLIFPSLSQAQLDNNFAGGGGIKIGDSTTTCTGNAGALRYDLDNSDGGGLQYCDGTTWAGVLPSSFAGVVNNGNSFSAPMIIGTNDANSLSLETNGSNRVTIDTSGNVGIGTATPDVALDVNAGAINAASICDENNANCFDISSGFSGVNALDDLSDASTSLGSSNFFLGHNGGSAGPSNAGNTGVGLGALDALTDATGADGNTALGRNALTGNVDGGFNTAVGSEALQANVSGQNNVAVGRLAASPSTANDQTAIGQASLRYTTTGSANTGVGSDALKNNTTGTRNTAVGYRAGGGNTAYADRGDMDQNTFVGAYAGGNIIGGTEGLGANNNVGLGYGAGSTLTDGDNNILIGFNVEPPTASTSNFLNIGDVITGDLASGFIGIGTTTPNVALDVNGSIEYTGTITDVSDRRLKENIRPIEGALETLTSVDGVSFIMKGDEKKRTEFGVIAQDLEEVIPELVHTAKDEMKSKSVNYIGFIGWLIEAIKDLASKDNERANRIAQLEGELQELKSRKDKRITMLENEIKKLRVLIEEKQK